MQDARTAVSALAREGQLVSFTIEAHSPSDQPLDLLRTFAHQDLHRFFAAQAVAGAQRVLEVQSHFIILT